MRHLMMAVPLVVLSLGAVALPALAQGEGAPPTARPARQRALEVILRNLSRGSGFTVLADSSLAEVQGGQPAEPTTADNLEAQLDELIKTLPRGTTWAKVMLPISNRLYRGDDVASFVDAQNRLFGKKPQGEPGTVEVLGQKLPQERATPVVSNLNLKPVYVLMNPTARLARGAGLTPDGQVDPNQLLQGFMSMDPAARQKMMTGMMQQMGSMLQNMSPEQRMEFMRSMRGAFPGGPGGGGGGRGIPPQKN